MKKLQLTRPIVFIDLETTGVNVASDRIIELGMLKIHPNGNRESKTMRINPTIPIPPETTAIHGISDADVKDCPTFKQLSVELNTFIEGSDLGGYNSNKFDIPLLAEEFLRCEIEFDVTKRKLVDVQNIFHKLEQRTLAAAYQFYCGKPLENAHSAEADINATFEILEAQLERYEILKPDVDFLSDFSSRTNNVDLLGRIVYNAKGIPVFNFGKHNQKPVTEVFEREPSYYTWMMNGDFPLYTKKVITQIRLGMKK
ncbi:MAG TPA: 3'-5' exonuclease [Bacteroidia bacterium]|jgi:DNA polymerase-3 subunit epsilon|nr:3'-5' exonuclease [Bacteroidia bacterium]